MPIQRTIYANRSQSLRGYICFEAGPRESNGETQLGGTGSTPSSLGALASLPEGLAERGRQIPILGDIGREGDMLIAIYHVHDHCDR